MYKYNLQIKRDYKKYNDPVSSFKIWLEKVYVPLSEENIRYRVLRSLLILLQVCLYSWYVPLCSLIVFYPHLPTMKAHILGYRPSGIIIVGFAVLTVVVRKSSTSWDTSITRLSSTFRKNMQPLSSGSKNKPVWEQVACRESRKFLAWLILIPWRWRRHVNPKRRLSFNWLHRTLNLRYIDKLEQRPPAWSFITISPMVLMFSEDKAIKILTISKSETFTEMTQ
jgi:hypothetical protein